MDERKEFLKYFLHEVTATQFDGISLKMQEINMLGEILMQNINSRNEYPSGVHYLIFVLFFVKAFAHKKIGRRL